MKTNNAPLRKLVEIVTPGIGRAKWLLECGHEIWVNDKTCYRARCWICAKVNTKTEPKKA